MNTDVQGAFALAWQVTQLYHSPVHETPVGHGEPRNKLPGLSNLPDAEQSWLLAREIGAGIRTLLPTPEGNHPSPSTDNLEKLLSGYPRSREAVRQATWDLHVELLESLTVADFQLGKAYGLGRAIAETAIRPVAIAVDERQTVYQSVFEPGRLERIRAWLSELKTSFGAHAAYAVQGSLERWATWVGSINLGEIDPGQTLAQQGHVWRGLLTGEKQATDLLKATDFIEAAVALLKRISQLAWRFVWSGYGIVLAVVIGAVIGAFVGISEVSSLSHSNKLAAQLVTAIAALGITTKGVMSTLGKIVAKAEGPLWDSELDESCAMAATRLPTGTKVLRRPRPEVGQMI